jgi:type II secretory pathway pseudopilin PulG
MKPDRSWLSQLIIQPVMIILSILAALAVNQWQESKARTQRVADARTAFVNEIRSNQELLLSEKYLPHHRRLQQEYGRVMKGELQDKNSFFETGVHPTPLRDSAWRVLSGTATLMDLPPEIVLALSDIYRAQDSLEKRNDGFLNAISAPRSDRETPAYAKDATTSIGMFLNDLVPAEERLLDRYKHALDKLSAPNAPNWSGGKAPDGR